MLKTLKLAGMKKVHLDLGHVGIYRAVIAKLKLDAGNEAALFDIVRRKSHPDLEEFVRLRGLKPGVATAISALLDLNGGVEVLARARAVPKGAGEEPRAELQLLARSVRALSADRPTTQTHREI